MAELRRCCCNYTRQAARTSPRIVTILEGEGLVNDATTLDVQSRGRLGGLRSNWATLLPSTPRRCIITSMSC